MIFNWNFNKGSTTLEQTAVSTALILLIKFLGDCSWDWVEYRKLL